MDEARLKELEERAHVYALTPPRTPIAITNFYVKDVLELVSEIWRLRAALSADGNEEGDHA